MSVYEVRVKTGTSQEKVVEADNGVAGDLPELTVYLRAKPHDGEANAALVKVLSRHFDVPKSAVVLKRGAKSHRKTVEILI